MAQGPRRCPLSSAQDRGQTACERYLECSVSAASVTLMPPASRDAQSELKTETGIKKRRGNSPPLDAISAGKLSHQPDIEKVLHLLRERKRRGTDQRCDHRHQRSI